MNIIPIYFTMFQSRYDIYPDMAFVDISVALKRLEMMNTKEKQYDGGYSYIEEFDENGRLIYRERFYDDEMRRDKLMFIETGKLVLQENERLEDVKMIHFYVDRTEKEVYIAYTSFEELKKNIKKCRCDRWCKLSCKKLNPKATIDMKIVTRTLAKKYKKYDNPKLGEKKSLPF